MSLASVRPFFRERLEALGYKEHNQPFEPEEIGANIVDDSFHLETGLITSGPANQALHAFSYPMTIRIYKTGYVNLNEAVDESMAIGDTVLNDLLQMSTRLSQEFIKDIILNSIQPTPLGPSNDNVIVLELNVTAELQLCF